jgi:cAMP-dependent protein kinase regulator
MYSAPRAASIVSQSPCTLWALDRVSFRTILLDVSEIPSNTVPCPDTNSIPPESDIYTSRSCPRFPSSHLSSPRNEPRSEGDAGEEFFLIESGTAAAIKGNDTILKQYTKGDYFGGKLAPSCCFHGRMIADIV